MVAKNYKYIVFALSLAIIAMTVVLAFALYRSGKEGVEIAKVDAKEALRISAERVINREYDQLKIPYYHSSGKGEKIPTKRRVINEKGIFIVNVDSMKEQQTLYSLETIGEKLDVLEAYHISPFANLLTDWKEEMNNQYKGGRYALHLKITPLDSSGIREHSWGDAIDYASQNIIGSYYMDWMYTTVLTAYFSTPAFWRCIDWKSSTVWPLLCIWFFLLCLGFSALMVLKYRSIAPNTIEAVYPIGRCQFDVARQVLLYEGREYHCTAQACKLLYAFVSAPDYSLSNDEIARVCEWALDDRGLSDRRRAAIMQLNKLLAIDDTIKIVSNSCRNGYFLQISLI